jgi:hypothetical protein
MQEEPIQHCVRNVIFVLFSRCSFLPHKRLKDLKLRSITRDSKHKLVEYINRQTLRRMTLVNTGSFGPVLLNRYITLHGSQQHFAIKIDGFL